MFALAAAARFSHFAALTLLFGLAVFPLYAGRPGQSKGLERLIDGCAVAVLVTGLLELAAMVANMGGSLGAVVDPQVISAAVTDTDFGRVWIARLALAAVLLAVRMRRRLPGDPVLVGLSGLALASVALTGHSSMPGGGLGLAHQIADAGHLLAAGWWIGGLAALLASSPTLQGAEAAPLLQRFSGIGYWAVAVIIATGLFKSAILIARPAALFGSAYGELLLLKLALVAGMGALALSNRFWITPALVRGADETASLRRLRVQVAVELCLGLMVLGVVGALGSMQPPISS